MLKSRPSITGSLGAEAAGGNYICFFLSHQFPPDVLAWSREERRLWLVTDQHSGEETACAWSAVRLTWLAGRPAAWLPVGLSDSCHTVIGLPAPCVSAL